MELDCRRIRVDFSATRKAHTPTPGQYMGRPVYVNQKLACCFLLPFIARKKACICQRSKLHSIFIPWWHSAVQVKKIAALLTYFPCFLLGSLP